MTFGTYQKLEVACQQLETALRLFFEADEYFSVITLAGAAEEILGAYLKIKGGTTSLESLVQGAARISKALTGTASEPKSLRKVVNQVKNSSKHMDGVADTTFTSYPKKDATDILNRAIDNYYELMSHENIPETPLVRQFNRYRVSDDA
jgi:hypothetical protein